MNSRPEQDDWVARLTGDDDERERAISDLRELLLRGLSKSMSSRYGGAFQAEDVVQAALIKILNSLDSFEGRSRFTTWAMTIATRVGISELRRRHFQDVSLDSLKTEDDVVYEVAIDDKAPADEQLEQQSILDTLRELIKSELTNKQRTALQALLNGMPVEEIARRNNSNRNAVYKLVHDARSRLKAGFARAGIVAEDVATTFA